MIDIHCHILPGLDDGAQSMDDAVAMARMAVDDGITTTVATPHYWENTYTATPQQVRRAVGEVQDRLADEGIPLKLLPGQEVMIATDVPRRVQNGDLLTLGDGGDYLLIELPMLTVPMYTDEVVSEIMSLGLTPIIAHPERNAAIQKQPKVLQQLVQHGCLVQLDGDSLSGSRWSPAYRLAAHLLNADLAHVLASDGHSPTQRPPVLSPYVRRAAAIISPELVEKMTVGTPERVVGPARVAIRAASSAASVMLSASHTHSGPCTTVLHGLGQPDARYLAFLGDTLASIVRSAFDSRTEAVIRHGRGPAQVGVNRRERQPDGGMRLGHNPTGPIAPHVDVVRADRPDGSPIAILFSHAAHPVTLGSRNLYVSADYPGYAQRFVARAHEDSDGEPVVALFAQGCCGNINCERGDGTFAQAQRLGHRLGAAAVKTAEYAEPVPELRIASVHETVALPLQDPPPLAEAEAQLEQQRTALANARESGEPRGRIQLHEGLVTWAEKVHKLARDGAGNRTQAFHMHAIGLGPLAVVGLPGEVFVEYAHAIQEVSPTPHTIVLGYANGCIGYVPTQAAFDEGGYEVDNAIRYYGTTMLTPACEHLILEAAGGLLAAL